MKPFTVLAFIGLIKEKYYFGKRMDKVLIELIQMHIGIQTMVNSFYIIPIEGNYLKNKSHFLKTL